MITAVDTCVLLDVFGADPSFGTRSADALRVCLAEGRLVACEAVFAEVAGFFPSTEAAQEALAKLSVTFAPTDRETALDAGTAWGRYRNRGGRRDRVAADFLIGSHAMRQADRLLTRDRGFYRTIFHGLQVLDPSR